MGPLIREYRQDDREEVRKIAVEASASAGYPRSDPRLLADLLTNYYLRYEPEHSIVAEVDGRVSGYLLGCLDTRWCRLLKSLLVIPSATIRSLPRGNLGLKELRYLATVIYVSIRGGLRQKSPRGYPAHFHVNVRSDYRGLGTGTSLVERFLDILRENGIPGVHVRVRRGDLKVAEFFKSFGFTRSVGYPVAVSNERGPSVSWSVIYVKEL